MSTADDPSATTPSTGMRDPGRMSNRSPAMTERTGTSRGGCPSPTSRDTVSGVRSMSPLMASEVRVRDTASRYLPSEMRAMSMAADS